MCTYYSTTYKYYINTENENNSYIRRLFILDSDERIGDAMGFPRTFLPGRRRRYRGYTNVAREKPIPIGFRGWHFQMVRQTFPRCPRM